MRHRSPTQPSSSRATDRRERWSHELFRSESIPEVVFGFHMVGLWSFLLVQVLLFLFIVLTAGGYLWSPFQLRTLLVREPGLPLSVMEAFFLIGLLWTALAAASVGYAYRHRPCLWRPVVLMLAIGSVTLFPSTNVLRQKATIRAIAEMALQVNLREASFWESEGDAKTSLSMREYVAKSKQWLEIYDEQNPR